VDRVRLSLLDLAVALLVGGLFVVALTGWDRGAPAGATLRADLFRTPGALNPDVTQATIGSTICVHGWTRTIRPAASYTADLKTEQMAQYGETGPPSAYQEDHLISLELGGHPTDPHNLWPQPYPRASEVDAIENDLNDDVCAGRLTLAEAQRREAALKHDYG
jgi:hypothetical protein